MTLPLAVLASGRGSNLRVLAEQISLGRLDARIALVLSNRPECEAVAFARAHALPVWAFAPEPDETRESFDSRMQAAIAGSGARAVILAGYMRILSAGFVRAFAGRMLNLHPSLLPAFPGARAGRDALAYGVRLAGCTVHFVDEELDGGPIVIQAALPVAEEDTVETLMPRVHALEHRILPQAVAWLAQDRLRVEGRRVRLLPAPGAQAVTPASPPCGDWLAHPPLESF